MSEATPEQNSNTESMVSTRPAPLRWWIAALLLPGMPILKFLPDWIENGPAQLWMTAAFGPLLIGLALILWWLLLSRSQLMERIVAAIGFALVVTVVVLLGHSSMREGPPVITTTFPLAIAGFTLGMILSAAAVPRTRVTVALLLTVLFSSYTLTIRTLGVWGDFRMDTAWRWEETADERIQNETGEARTSIVSAAAARALETALENPTWSGFRGNQRDGRSAGSTYDGRAKPEELWRVDVGPGWSSFAVAGSFLFTQEQRGDLEALVCYDAENGQQVWATTWESRFFDALGGLGPRSSPTIDQGNLYVQGAKGDLLKVDGRTGKILWKKDIYKLSQRSTDPMWGYSSSPWVDQQHVYAYAAGEESGVGVIAFNKETGETVWKAPAGAQSYSSPQGVLVAGQDLITLLSDQGAHFYNPQSGEIVLDYAWKYQGYRALQPQVIGEDRFLIPTGLGTGTRLVRLDGYPLQATELWTSLKMKPDFNDLAVYEGGIYGFDGAYLACLDAETGEQRWKGSRYGKGQLVLLPQTGLLLVISEKGKLAAVRATPEDFEELWVIDALDGKTWNHPVVVGDRLYVRNANQAVAYRLPDGSP